MPGSLIPFTLPYLEGPDGIRRPYLYLDLRGPGDEAHTFRGLIDSGADWSVLPKGSEVLFGYSEADLVRQPDGHQVDGRLQLWRAPAPIEARVVGLNRLFKLDPMFVRGATSILWGRLDFLATYGLLLMQNSEHFALMVEPGVDFPL